MVSIVQQIDTQHEDMIHDAVADYYGTKLATCSSDRNIKIFSIFGNNYQLIAELKGHEGPVWQLAWANPAFGTILASCSYDRKVFIWKETTSGNWEKIYEYAGHDSSVNSICWAPKEFDLTLITGSSDGAISILSSSGRDNVWTTKKIPNAHSIGVNAVSWAPAIMPASSLFYSENSGNKPPLVRRFVTGGCDNLVKIWKYIQEEDKCVEEHKLEGHSDWVRDVAWSPSIGVLKSYIASCSQDRRVLIWSLDGPSNTWTYKVLHTFDDVVWHVSWSAMGNILAVSGGDNKISLWKENLNGDWICISDTHEKSN
ncbi:protein SEC13-like protein [Dinothrombium tinctorium]|uniref:Protein SEC13 homolog n=2 Tax=Dinothrombium tinctorium TaxID=1965070 RepID=A0A3S3NMY0_9ACAR|nr:protein SEC13-like protein [Dinothrombium tinctorium]RWS05885.1 protein SEC13-like protein [Dinothrombium tinctorium]